MNPLSKIVFITANYPSQLNPSSGVFVANLVRAMAGLGVECTVIHPLKISEIRQCFSSKLALHREPRIRVLRPLTMSLSNRSFGPVNTFILTHRSFRGAAWRAFKSLGEKPDAVYGHFLYPAGQSAVWIGRTVGLPSFVAVGESVGEQGLWSVRCFSKRKIRDDYRGVTGVLAVSSLLRNIIEREVGVSLDKIAVFPNGVDLAKFTPRPQRAMRKSYGLPNDAFLVIFVGAFIERKGVRRVAEAISGLGGVGGIFVGSGPQVPSCPNVVFSGEVDPADVPGLLSAADCFVLPSTAEGSSNATLEAMACGLPIVTSTGQFMSDIVDEKVALRVRPDDVKGLRAAILMLRDNHGLRARMSRACLQKAREFDIRERASRVLEWMTDAIYRYNEG